MENSKTEVDLEIERCEAIAAQRVFPQLLPLAGGAQFQAYGITRRELFAMAAMQGYCTEGCGGSVGNIASNAVKQADALIEELSK